MRHSPHNETSFLGPIHLQKSQCAAFSATKKHDEPHQGFLKRRASSWHTISKARFTHGGGNATSDSGDCWLAPKRIFKRCVDRTNQIALDNTKGQTQQRLTINPAPTLSEINCSGLNRSRMPTAKS